MLDERPEEPQKLRSFWRDKRTPAAVHVILFFTVSKVLLRPHGQHEGRLKDVWREGSNFDGIYSAVPLCKPYYQLVFIF